MEILYTFGIIGGVILVIFLIKVWLYERKINFLHKERNRKIEAEKERMKGYLTSILETKIKILKKEYNPKIEELERKRRFILDKLPFIEKITKI